MEFLLYFYIIEKRSGFAKSPYTSQFIHPNVAIATILLNVSGAQG
jgi:hypothetical protein